MPCTNVEIKEKLEDCKKMRGAAFDKEQNHVKDVLILPTLLQ
jgi:hypothetical protein